MNRILPVLAVLIIGAIFICAGCGHKKDAKGELEKAAEAFGSAEPAPAQTQPTPAAAVPAAESAATPAQLAPEAAPAPSPRQMLTQALESYRTGDFEKAVTRLQLLRSVPTLSPEQRMAVQDGVAAVMGELYALAAKGDARAIQAVKQYEQMQTAPRL
jgi:hypothetical protein